MNIPKKLCRNQNCRVANTARPLVEINLGKCAYCKTKLDTHVPLKSFNCRVGKQSDASKIWTSFIHQQIIQQQQ